MKIARFDLLLDHLEAYADKGSLSTHERAKMACPSWQECARQGEARLIKNQKCPGSDQNFCIQFNKIHLLVR